MSGLWPKTARHQGPGSKHPKPGVTGRERDSPGVQLQGRQKGPDSPVARGEVQPPCAPETSMQTLSWCRGSLLCHTSDTRKHAGEGGVQGVGQEGLPGVMAQREAVCPVRAGPWGTRTWN